MLNKKIMVLAIFFVSLLAISAVSAADNVTEDVVSVEETTVDVVKETTDEVVSVENDENGNILKGDTAGFDELMDEIKHGTSLVVLSHKNYKIDKGVSILLNRPFTIDGNGATIDMNGKNFAIFIAANDRGVGIRNLIIKNMDADNEKGVIQFSDTPGSIINCTFVNNRASSGVGAIQVSGPDHVRIINCTFVNNFGNESGAIYFREGCYDSKVENCAFVGNSADSGKSAIGGKDTGSIPLNDNWWGSNNPDWAKLIYGAEPSSYAVLNVTTDTPSIAIGSKAKLNYAFYRNGTADRLSLPARQIKLSTTGGKLDKTSGDLINEFSTEFSSNTPGYYEITATVDNEKIKIPIYVVNKFIYVNSSVDSSGDGKTNETPFKTLKEALDVAEDYDTIMIAAGTYAGSNNVDLTIEKNNLIFNKYGDGDAIFDAQGDCRIWTVNTSSSTIININGLTFKNGNAKSGNYGGAIYFKNNVVDSNINAAFINNTAMYGGAIYYSGKVTDSSLSGICINNTETSVIYMDGESENSVIHDAVFINNYNNNNIYVKSGTINVTNCWFGNNATNYNEKPDIGIDLNDWLFLNATAEPGEIKLGQSSTITFKLYNKNSPAAEYDASKMNIILDLNQTLGELDKTTVSLGEKTSYTAKESGNASVTGKFETASYTINLKNKPKIPVDIILENETIDLEVGDEVSAGATLEPPVGNLTYTSCNESVVIVENGVIKAVGEGTANVAVSFNGTDEYASAERNITVCVLSEAEWYYMADGRINNLDGASGLILPFGVYTCVVLDSNGQPLSKGLNVNIKLNDDYIINATVGEDGMFDLDINGIKTGKYTATFSSYGYTHAVASFFIVKKQTDITLENSTMALKVNDIVASGATLNPADAGDLKYTSSNSSVAIVENGNIKAIAIGTAVITVSFSGNANYYATKNKTIEVTVSKIPTEITVQNSTLDMKVGDGTVIVATLTPVGAGNVSFTSSNESVVEVDDEGNVLAQGKGQAIITVSFAGNNNCTAAENRTVTVTVSLNDASVTVDNDTLDLKIGEKYAINATKRPDTIVLDITYTSSNRSVATVDRKGIVTAVGEGTAVITVEVGEEVIYAKNSTTITVKVSKIGTEIKSSAISTVYNIDKKLVVTLTDDRGKPISGAKVTVDLKGVKTYTTDKNGQVKLSTKGLAPKKYTAKVTFNGDALYDKSTKDIKVTVKKATPKVTAKKKTFKKALKTKKYVITLKDNRGKVIKGTKVTLKIKGKKAITVKTNSKGKATFKIKKLTKKGKYKAKIIFKGNKYYNKVTKTVKIKIK